MVAPSPEAMRIWMDVIVTGAEGYTQFMTWVKSACNERGSGRTRSAGHYYYRIMSHFIRNLGQHWLNSVNGTKEELDACGLIIIYYCRTDGQRENILYVIEIHLQSSELTAFHINHMLNMHIYSIYIFTFFILWSFQGSKVITQYICVLPTRTLLFVL